MKKIIFVLAALSLAACNDKKESTNVLEETVVETKKNGVLLYTLDGGEVSANNLNLFAQGETYKGQAKKLVDPYYVIKHPLGTLIWDTGLPEGLVGQNPYTTPDKAFTIARRDSLVNQLAGIGMKPSDINYIAFSHIHFDHTGAANYFGDATWLVQTPEYEFAMSEEIKQNGFYDPSSYAQLKKVQQLNGDHDVFGDGSVIIKSMPGHTPGHQVLYLNMDIAGPVLLSGDMYHFYENRENGIVPQFNHDIPQSELSIKAFEAFATETGATVYIQHEPADFAKMPIAPNALN